LGAAVLASVMGAQGPMTVRATIAEEALTVGRPFTVELGIDYAEGWSGDDGGVPGAIVQLDVPDSVRPVGRVLTEFRELSRNEFLQAPYERLVRGDEASIELTLVGEPGDDDRIGVNVIAYLTNDDGRAVFARRRVELPVAAGAEGSADNQALRSDWGTEAAGLQIGEKAPDFTLPRADGSTLTLSERLGEGSVIVTTYRAFW
jgi:hypothetical protein